MSPMSHVSNESCLLQTGCSESRPLPERRAEITVVDNDSTERVGHVVQLDTELLGSFIGLAPVTAKVCVRYLPTLLLRNMLLYYYVRCYFTA